MIRLEDAYPLSLLVDRWRLLESCASHQTVVGSSPPNHKHVTFSPRVRRKLGLVVRVRVFGLVSGIFPVREVSVLKVPSAYMECSQWLMISGASGCPQPLPRVIILWLGYACHLHCPCIRVSISATSRCVQFDPVGWNFEQFAPGALMHDQNEHCDLIGHSICPMHTNVCSN